MAIEQDIASMLEEIERVLQKYRVRIQGGTSSDFAGESPEMKRLQILRFVSENGPVFPEELYIRAEKMNMSRQGLGGFFRGTNLDHSKSKSLLNYEGEGSQRQIAIGNHGVVELARLKRLHPSV